MTRLPNCAVNILASLLTLLTCTLFSLFTHASEDYVGSQACGNCHQQQYKAWSNSHHAQAMQEANETSVLGEFNNTPFIYGGKTSKFYKKGTEFWVNTESSDGKMVDYKISYTFGFYPLQQYLIAFPDGRYQALSIAWDDRNKSMGGKRWFHLYPEDTVDFQDPLHWTGPYQNWNSRCADCHTTGWKKNYQTENDQYNSQWSESGVGCESCHGPGSKHALNAKKGFIEGQDLHILNDKLNERGTWILTASHSVASRSTPLSSDNQVQLCAACHSRRTPIAESNPSKPYLNQFTPALLDNSLYHADGQIKDEVFVAGSFWQSTMYHEGVVCSNCHDSHSGNLISNLNGTCLQCHAANTYAIEKHHHHPDSSKGAICVNCHMPETTYMQVDPRRDHSIRVPDLQLSQQVNSPNVCADCHQDKSKEWLTNTLQTWKLNAALNNKRKEKFNLLATSRGTNNRAQHAKQQLLRGDFPAIIQATVLADSPPVNQQEFELVIKALTSNDALERLGAARAFSRLNPTLGKLYLWPLLDDKTKAVRLETTRILSAIPETELTATENSRLQLSIDEYIKAQEVMADTAVAWLNIAQVQFNRNQIKQAEKSYHKALMLEPAYIPVLLNLADLYRATGRDWQGRALLQQATRLAPEDATAQYSMAMFLIRQKKYQEALTYLQRANELLPHNSNFAYSYVLLLIELGENEKAIKEAERVTKNFKSPKPILQLLLNLYQQKGQLNKAQEIQQRLRKEA